MSFKIFRSLEIGGISKKELIADLRDKNVQLNDYAEIILEYSQFDVMNEKITLDLAKVTPQELGFEKPVKFSDIVKTAALNNLELCSLSLAAFLRLDFLDQEEGPYLTVACLKPRREENSPNGFYLRNIDGEQCLRGYRADSDYLWPIESELIFVLVSDLLKD